jgi:hypothetical protein
MTEEHQEFSRKVIKELAGEFAGLDWTLSPRGFRQAWNYIHAYGKTFGIDVEIGPEDVIFRTWLWITAAAPEKRYSADESGLRELKSDIKKHLETLRDALLVVVPLKGGVRDD